MGMRKKSKKTKTKTKTKTRKDIIDISEIYTPLSVAKKEIQKRWKDKKLRKKVNEYLGEVPRVFKYKPKVALFRFITTPNFEFQLALDTAILLKKELIFIEFLNDKFCTRNQDKLYLGKIVFFHEKNGESAGMTDRRKIIDLEKADNKPFKKIKTIWGENLIDFHHDLFNKYYKNTKIFDVSTFKTNGETSYEVYLKMFAIFICHGVLFENYFVNSNKDERKFTLKVIKPAFEKIKEIFGVKPLIVPLVGFKDEGDLFWQYYPEKIKKEIKQINNKKK